MPFKMSFMFFEFLFSGKAYQATLRIEEKLLRKQYTMRKGPGYGRDNQKKKKWKKVKVAPTLWTSLLEEDLMLIEERG
jgi:hypothetical protein